MAHGTPGWPGGSGQGLVVFLAVTTIAVVRWFTPNPGDSIVVSGPNGYQDSWTTTGTKKHYGSRWPLTVPRGEVICLRLGGGYIDAEFSTKTGPPYALNHIAEKSAHIYWIGPIRDDGPASPNHRKHLAPQAASMWVGWATRAAHGGSDDTSSTSATPHPAAGKA